MAQNTSAVPFRLVKREQPRKAEQNRLELNKTLNQLLEKGHIGACCQHEGSAGMVTRYFVRRPR